MGADAGSEEVLVRCFANRTPLSQEPQGPGLVHTALHGPGAPRCPALTGGPGPRTQEFSLLGGPCRTDDTWCWRPRAARRPACTWFEEHGDNYMGLGWFRAPVSLSRVHTFSFWDILKFYFPSVPTPCPWC